MRHERQTPSAELLESRRLFATFVVTNTADSGPGSLRDALFASNASVGVPDTITFQIGAGVQTIRPTTVLDDLPNITDRVTIDGTAPAAFPTQVIELSGELAPVDANGLQINGPGGDGSVIRRLVINRFGANGIEIEGSGNVIEGNRIGTDASGAVDVGNGADGVSINSGTGNRVGGTTAAQGNVISGNTGNGVDLGAASTGTVVVGNLIGTNAAGTGVLGNTGYGVRVVGSQNNDVGGTTAGERNVISANNAGGVHLSGTGATGNRVRGNYIGTDAGGTADLGNGGDGVRVSRNAGDPATLNTIGGTEAGAGNVISGNAENGIGLRGLGLSGAAGTVLIQGNRIGTNAAGTGAVGNGTAGTSGTGFGIELNGGVYDVTVGGASAASRNLISGNLADGIRVELDAGTAAVRGNYIGTNAAGTAALPNANDGVNVRSGGNTIGGDAAGQGNLLSGNADDGIEFNGAGATGNVVQGNLIGTDASGLARLGNGSDGIEIEGADGNTIGTAGAGGNVVSGNTSDGIEVVPRLLTGSPADPATQNVIRNNLVGVGRDGATALGNGVAGVNIAGDFNTVGGTAAGQGNVIARNTLDGVFVEGGVGNAVRGNSIYLNGGLGIDLAPDGVTANDAGDADAGPNGLQNHPVITSAVTNTGGTGTVVQGTLGAAPNTAFTVDLYSSPAADPSGRGEGQTFLGSVNVTTDAAGAAGFSFTTAPAVAAGHVVTATATAAASGTATTAGDTSEFSPAVAAGPSTGAASVTDRHVFYNRSVYDGNDPAPTPADDAAVAPDKDPLLPGGTASAANVTSYSRGINGVMVDVLNLPNDGAGVGVNDVSVRTTSPAAPNTWSAGPAPSSVTVRPGAGAGGSDRVTIIWADGAITNRWAEVTLLGNTDTGLPAADVFRFGSLVGDADASRTVNLADFGALRASFNASNLSVANGRADFNRDGTVNLADFGALRQNFGKSLPATPPASSSVAASLLSGADEREDDDA